MRFMMLMKFNEELAKTGALISLDGLHPRSMGVRVAFSGGKPKVTDGPLIEAKEVIGGYWMIDVKHRWRSASNSETQDIAMEKGHIARA